MAIQGFHVLGFHFRAIQLNQLNWKDFKEVRNPVASALMTRMGVAREDRPRVKWECYRMLVKLELDPARLQLLSGFIDAYLPLEPREEVEFQARAATGTPEEREAVMELTNSWIERGREEGREESRQREAELACRLLQKRLGPLTPERENIIRGLPVERLERLVEAIFEIEAEADLDRWL